MYSDLLGSEVNVITAVSDGEAAISAARTYQPDLMLLDIAMGAMNGFAVARWLKEHMPAVKTVFVTMHSEPAYVEEAARIGAEGYVLKSNAVGELLGAVRTVLGGGSYFPQIGKKHRA